MESLSGKIVDFYWKGMWERFKQGDIQAFETIYREHVDFLFGYGTKMTPDSGLVEDAIHDLFLYILSRKENLTDPLALRYYLLKAFKRILMKKIQDARAYASGNAGEIFTFNLAIEVDDSGDPKLKERKLEMIESLIEELEPKKKEILFLKFYSGMSYEEIAGMVGIQPDSAKKVVYRTISSFRSIVQKKILELFFLFTAGSG